MHPFRIGTAGWTIPRQFAHEAPLPGTHLARYARVLPCVEINSSFYRPHRSSTWARWAEAVPDNFRFSVKVPKTITHDARLASPPELLETFLSEITHLGEKLGPILFQLPPSAEFNQKIAESFLHLYRTLHQGQTVFEPRHLSWFTPAADQLLHDFHIARAAADPPIAPAAFAPDLHAGLLYHRLHGAPRMYYSDYPPEFLQRLTHQITLQREHVEVWCIFDNTALGHAFSNALALHNMQENAEKNDHRVPKRPAVL